MKGDITIKILESIHDLGMDAASLFKMFLTVGYGASYGKMQYTLSKTKSARQTSQAWNIEHGTKQKYYSLLCQLKKDGLIKKEARGRKGVFIITKKGLERLSLLKERSQKRMPPAFYQKSQGNTFVIIAFDIPEKERGRRDWLRSVLKNLGLKMVQKSLWLGKVKIPKEFIDDLSKLNLLNYVEIFEITKTGSLKNLD